MERSDVDLRRVDAFLATPAAQRPGAGDAVKDVRDRFGWMVSPDQKGNHTVPHEHVEAVMRLVDLLSQPASGEVAGG